MTSVVVEAPDLKDPRKKYAKTYTAAKDIDILSAVRDGRFQEMIGHEGHNAGVGLLAEAYYLTGDAAYARKAVQMLDVFARRYHSFTRHFFFQIHREDRDWWGARIDGRYQAKYGPRTLQSCAAGALDLIWDAISPQDRTMIEHNLMRWGMYEGMDGSLKQFPEQFAAANREDFPYMALGNILGDPEPRNGLRYFYEIYRDVVFGRRPARLLAGQLWRRGTYVEFMKKLSDLGVPVADNKGLRNAFLTQPRFIFSGGGMPNIDDGGGVAIQGLGAGFGCPAESDYRWAEQMYHDPLLGQMPALVVDGPKRLRRTAGKTPGRPACRVCARASTTSTYSGPACSWLRPRAWPCSATARRPSPPIGSRSSSTMAATAAGRTATRPSWPPSRRSMGRLSRWTTATVGTATRPAPDGTCASYSHNVVVVDGRDQRGAVGPVVMGRLREARATGDVQWIDAESDKLYDGVAMRRVVFTTDVGIIDLFLCQSNEEHVYDWMFHSFGAAKPGIPLADVPKLADGGPLTFAIGPRAADADSDFQVTWENHPMTKPARKASTALLGEDTSVRLWGLGSKGTRVALFAGPIQPDVVQEGQIDYVMLRRRARTTLFATVQEPWRNPRARRSARCDPGGDCRRQTRRCHRRHGDRNPANGRDQAGVFGEFYRRRKDHRPGQHRANVACWPIAGEQIQQMRCSAGAALRVDK